MAPMIPRFRGILRRFLPFLLIMEILRTLPSAMSSLTFLTNSLPSTLKVSVLGADFGVLVLALVLVGII